MTYFCIAIHYSVCRNKLIFMRVFVLN